MYSPRTQSSSTRDAGSKWPGSGWPSPSPKPDQWLEASAEFDFRDPGIRSQADFDPAQGGARYSTDPSSTNATKIVAKFKVLVRFKIRKGERLQWTFQSIKLPWATEVGYSAMTIVEYKDNDFVWKDLPDGAKYEAQEKHAGIIITGGPSEHEIPFDGRHPWQSSPEEIKFIPGTTNLPATEPSDPPVMEWCVPWHGRWALICYHITMQKGKPHLSVSAEQGPWVAGASARPAQAQVMAPTCSLFCQHCN